MVSQAAMENKNIRDWATEHSISLYFEVFINKAIKIIIFKVYILLLLLHVLYCSSSFYLFINKFYDKMLYMWTIPNK